MGLPAPSASQQQSLEQLKAVAEAGVQGAIEKQAAIETALVKQQDVEDFNKTTFDVLNDDIIGQYETERRWIDGLDIANKINETDIQEFANYDETSRLWNNQQFPPLRIDEFDGGPLVFLQQDNELDLFENQNTLLTLLQSGYPGQVTISNGAEIKDAINDGSDSLTILGNTETISVGNVMFVEGGGLSGLLEVTSIVVGGVCSDPQYEDESSCTTNTETWTREDYVGFEWLLSPGGTLPAESAIGQKTFGGFTDSERTNKTANDPSFQSFMDTLLSRLHTNFNNRKTALNNQIATINANEDDNIDLTARTNAQTSISEINILLGNNPPSTIDISDSGIIEINDERDVRKPQAEQRILDIASAIDHGASGTLSYYDQRYQTSEGRCRLNNGSIVLLNDLTKAKQDVQAGGAESQGLADRYGNLI